ncbi:MAG: hypothetical protein UY92_C0013G0068 [Candidatus Magasanikbacteria bacterium GW2011_GWA2_56_11]|uniref:Methyltransferase type 11 n=1 Tax=Candidatus Magasanikbacteria bacterium GW2011_GWA2_56_11 TaxID=1619044 RepID=A0A0G2B8T4_9BACT|nr:MAG: hypothetical protein UY92_C0013G0068 [Candidatus Magasanikbacteria bacterium GW2011_GWA2_56_11]
MKFIFFPTSPVGTYNEYQYKDFLQRESDPYAQAKYRVVLEYLRDRPGATILNAGCGSGELSFLLAAAGHSVVGIDPGAEYIALAAAGAAERGCLGRCSFRVSSIAEFAAGNKFDCVVATDVLEHIENDAAALDQLLNLLRPGGSLIITVPALPALFGYHDELLGHFRRYTRSSLRALLDARPVLEVKKIRYFGFTLLPVCWLFSRYLRRPYPAASLSGRSVSVRQIILRLLLAFDRTVPMPLGTSLISLAVKTGEKTAD